MTNDSGTTATPARSAVPEPAGPAPVERLTTEATTDTTTPPSPPVEAVPPPAGDEPAEYQPAEYQPAEYQPAEYQPAEYQPADDELADGLADDRPAGQPAAGPAPNGIAPAAAGALAALSLIWLAAMLWVAHATISSDVGVVALATAASTLPSIVSAALVAGAGAGLFAVVRLGATGGSAGSGGDRPGLDGGRLAGRMDRAGTRFAVAVGAGLATGVVAGTAFVAGSGTDPARMALAGTLAAGATVGGALGGARNPRAVAAVVAAGLAVFAAGFAFGLFKGQIQAFYGAGDDEASQLSAAGWFAATAAVASGLAAGVTAYRVLGGARRNPGTRWPAYLVAGAGPGALLLVTELVTRTGGAKLLGLVRQISDADRALQAWAEGSRVNNALVVLFVGAVVAVVGLGRTLPGPADREP